ncbi:hypothetical protein F53441_8507 [Fusarium austroafricanum]|uniref:Uncharacterized protein n=1 Tax=Fusarium austroafricanum TaxID=2364996 RepID=A0A8H4KCR3_9HYPO|nr:hypothetical protein F53441_8507 [Fusarium austroafricanum]
MAYNANQPETPISARSPTEVGSPEAVQPHHMNNANLYLEEQYPKYIYEPDHNNLPEAVEPDKEKHQELDGRTVSPKNTVFGIRRRWFVIGVVVALIVIVAAIGGGVGGSMAHKNNKVEAEAAAAAASSTSSVSQDDSTEEASQATSTPTHDSVITKTITETRTRSTQLDNHLIAMHQVQLANIYQGENDDNNNKEKRSDENDETRNQDNRVLRRGNCGRG